jgi:DNA-binding response OmpR family regulator
MKNSEQTCAAARPVCILLVGDFEPVRTLLKVVLGNAGYYVLAADRGAMALRLAATCRPNLALLDVELPDMNGIQLCHRLREHAELNPLPVVFMSGQAEGLYRRLIAEVPQARLLPKPVHFELLLEALVAAWREAAREIEKTPA